ncbi:dipeptidase [Paenibacillus sp. 1001270B_150601_E10]|uniref:dipeptidase n=1 Tax=Paenibacillus sp. 1001270B_150601_E10 TaxID=2787079 RepID=UPI00189E69EB|nr:dipeptidase [Paenibacillus sp. 1001270B_150601_E10]
MNSRLIDFHCDVLYKMLYTGEVDFVQHDTRDVTLPKLREGGVGLQVLALFVEPSLVTGPPRFSQLVRMIDLYHEEMLKHPELQAIRWKQDLEEWQQASKIGTILSLEGVDALEGDLVYLRTLYHLGVRFVGLTWNHSNWAVDGTLEPRQGGFTETGKQLIEECERLGITLDVSHLNEKAFWELLELTDRPIIASHSNAASVFKHPRNLTDDQIKAIIDRNGRIGITYVPYFVADKEEVTIEDLVKHIDHIVELGGSKNLMLGSDFDGIDKKIKGLEHAGQHPALLEALEKQYGQAFVQDIAHTNAYRFLKENLPSRAE